MRIEGGFSLDGLLGEFPELRSLISSEAPGLSRRFSFLDDLEDAGPESLGVAFAGVRLSILSEARAGCVLAEPGVEGFAAGVDVVRVAEGRRALAILLRGLAPRIASPVPYEAGANNAVHPSAVVEGVLEGGVIVEAGAYVAAGSFVGRGSRIGANAVIGPRCVLGPRAEVQAGAVIGEAGFGFFAGSKGAEAMPHLAGVVLGADVFVGANTVIAAGVLRPTEVGDGCKLDSHVQIAHNVRLGAGSMLASQAGIAGSTRTGENLRMGGAASVAGHLRLGRGVSVAAKSGVTKDVPDGGVVAGFPARPIAEWRRAQAALRRLGGA